MRDNSALYEGNTGDCTTLREIIQSIERTGLPASEKKIIVMDAGISTAENLRFLKENHYHYDGTKAHLHLAILAYWVVSCSRYQLKQVGIRNDWSEILRILSTHKIVSTRMEQTNGEWIEIRQCTQH
ncbi:MAG: hypothetical protein LBG96_17685 [Tannerella sp.]|nr:hypothetical protein [Tannerella sp.]